MDFKLLAVVAACAVSSLSYGQSSNSNSGAVAGSSSTNSSTNNNTSNNNPVANANSGSSSGSVSNANGGQGGTAIGNNGNNQSNNRANSSSNSSTASTSTANNAGNNQNNASSSKATGGTAIAGGGAGGAGGQGGQGGIGVGGSAGINANISPSTSITFTGPPVSTSNIRTTGETTQNLNQSYTGRTEQVLSGETSQYIDYGGTQTIKNVPNVNAPPLTSSNDTCMGSVSGGVAVAGLGLTGGSTYTDEHCKRIKMSRELWNKGMKAASLAMDCMDPAAREALEITGFTCPQTTRAQQRAGAPAAQAQQVAATRGAMRPDPSREQPGYAEPSPVTTQVAEAGALRSTPTRQPDDSVTVRRVDLPLDRRQP